MLGRQREEAEAEVAQRTAPLTGRQGHQDLRHRPAPFDDVLQPRLQLGPRIRQHLPHAAADIRVQRPLAERRHRAVHVPHAQVGIEKAKPDRRAIQHAAEQGRTRALRPAPAYRDGAHRHDRPHKRQGRTAPEQRCQRRIGPRRLLDPALGGGLQRCDMDAHRIHRNLTLARQDQRPRRIRSLCTAQPHHVTRKRLLARHQRRQLLPFAGRQADRANGGVELVFRRLIGLKVTRDPGDGITALTRFEVLQRRHEMFGRHQNAVLGGGHGAGPIAVHPGQHGQHNTRQHEKRRKRRQPVPCLHGVEIGLRHDEITRIGPLCCP